MRRSIYPNGSGGGADFDVIVADQAFTSLTQLEAAHPAADNQFKGAIVLSGGGPGRLFFSTGSAWVPTVDVVWSVTSSGSTGERALRSAAGAAVWHGDLGVLGDGSVLYAVVDDDRQVAWIPSVLPGGVRLGVTHEATPIHFELFRDPTTNATSVGETANTTIDYDTTVADRMAIYAGTGASDNATLTYAVTIPANAAGYVLGVLGCDMTQPSPGGFLMALRHEVSGSLRRFDLLVDTDVLGGADANKWNWIVSSAGSGAVGNYIPQGGDLSTVEQDRIWYVDTDGDGHVYQDYPTPTGVAASTATESTDAPVYLTTTGTASLFVQARDDASTPARATLEGFFAIAIEAI